MYTALHLACRKGNVVIVRQLLSCVGINTHIKNKTGKTALECCWKNEAVQKLFQAMCPATSTIPQILSPPETPPQEQQPQPPSASDNTSSLSSTSPQPTTTTAATTPNTSKALEEGGDIINNNFVEKQERDSGEITAKQQINEITELKARITQLEDENVKNLNLLHDERKSREVDKQRFQEMKQFYEERETDNKQRFRDLRHYTNHVISHVEQGEGGTWCNILSENYDDNNNNCCKRSQIRIDFEDLPSFDEIVCAFCPLQMAVKIIISRKFGVEPTQQVIFTADPENNNSEELLTDSSRTLEDIQQQQQDNNSNTNVVQIKVRIKSTTTIQEKDLKVVSTLGVGSYGTVFKCSFLHNAATSSSSSSETTSFVAVKALHEIIKSESNITRFQQEALISSRLRHPNIVRCLGTCITSTGSLWIVSELMELSLRQLLHHKDLTFMEVVAVSSGIAKGMSALHRRNIMHRDLSSNNVLLDSHGTPKITDFGVSRAIQNQIGCGWSKPAPTGSFTNGAGTPIYLPPQMHTGHYRIQGDMWEFSVLLSELLQREVPSVNTPKSSAQVTEFMRLQRASLSPPEIAEVDWLCDDVGDIPVAECLGRRIAIISALRCDPKMNNNNVPRACVGLFSLVVESCLSILEIDRPSFPAIDKVLMTCAEIVFTNSRPATTTGTATTTNNTNEVTGHITRCLANIAASFSDHRS
ncbi:Serine/threonine-protein kinase, active site [Pelomyxa schiedti]|nr:Serine/threonine-protein kinase, active site [Pelomyxa schiedti]